MLPILFAPLQGFTEAPYRRVHNSVCGGVSSYYSPFIRVEKGSIRNKDLNDNSASANSGITCIPQAIARDSAELSQIVDFISSEGYKRLDINMGCPYPMQTRLCRGAGILPHPNAVQDICNFISQHAEISFSIKMRLGLDSDSEWLNIIESLNNTPLSHITMHPRIGRQMYKGDINISAFSDFLATCRHPVIYNGDICSLEDIHRIEDSFPGLAGIMIGRGLLARPTLAREYSDSIFFCDEQVLSLILAMHHELVSIYSDMYPDENQRLGKLHAFWEYLEQPIGRKTWKAIAKSTKWQKYLDITNHITT